LLVKLTPRNVNLGNGRFAMFNKERDISGNGTATSTYAYDQDGKRAMLTEGDVAPIV
jgi:hypothetical protein